MKNILNHFFCVACSFTLIIGSMAQKAGVTLLVSTSEHAHSHEHCDYDYKSYEAYSNHYLCCEIGAQTQGAMIQPLNASTVNYSSCNTVTYTHGSGRELGYNGGYFYLGCGNYKSNSYSYGTTNIPLCIIGDMSDEMTNAVLSQLEIWNEVAMYDGTNKFINFYEVDYFVPIENKYPIRIKEEVFEDSNILGKFDDASGIVFLSQDIFESPEYLRTPLHELGHVLGLGDLDNQYGRNHSVLMGYIRDEIEPHKAIDYQDIQGAAVMTGKHSAHTFDKFAVMDGTYYYICFYCDMIDSRNTPSLGGSPLIEFQTCSHNYKLMVSTNSSFWHKCINCYKVTEDDHKHNFTSSKATYTAYVHTKKCNNCDYSVTESHDFYQRLDKTYCNGCRYSTSNPPGSINYLPKDEYGI